MTVGEMLKQQILPAFIRCICLCVVTFSECMFVSPNILFVITSDILYICVNLLNVC